jgi:Fur family ferric uptake transcriptional regulator
MMARQLYLQKLKAGGYSNTQVRRVLFETLLNSGHQPKTMAQLIAATEGVADRASVYRAVDILQSIGIINRLNIGWKYKLELSDDFHGHHHHMNCGQCGKTISAEDDKDFEAQLHRLASTYGFTITDHQLQIQGICNSCKNI